MGQAACRMTDDDLIALRRRLERAEKLAIAGELASRIAHEIKNPLAPIRGYAQLLQEKLGVVDASQREIFARGLGVILDEAARIERQVYRLLDLSRPDRAVPVEQGTVDLNQAVVEAIRIAEGVAGARRFDLDLDPALPLLAVDGDEIRGVLLNLLKNAIEAMLGMDAARPIAVVTRREGEGVVIEVIDQGTGLEPEALERAFEPFFTTKADGTGLGLAIARSAVEAAGGEIQLLARPAGGVIAQVRLPLPAAAGAPAHEAER